MEPNQTNSGNSAQFNQIPSNPINSPVQTPVQTAPNTCKKVGPVMVILVVVLILIMAGLYLFASKVNQNLPTDVNIVGTEYESLSAAANSAPVVKEITNKADDLQSLEKDLQASDEGLTNF